MGAGIVLSAVICGCKVPNSDSDTQAIFAEPQRFPVPNSEDRPMIMAIAPGCAGFVIDADRKIAMSAHHCEIVADAPLCINASHYSEALDKYQVPDT